MHQEEEQRHQLPAQKQRRQHPETGQRVQQEQPLVLDTRGDVQLVAAAHDAARGERVPAVPQEADGAGQGAPRRQQGAHDATAVDELAKHRSGIGRQGADEETGLRARPDALLCADHSGRTHTQLGGVQAQADRLHAQHVLPQRRQLAGPQEQLGEIGSSVGHVQQRRRRCRRPAAVPRQIASADPCQISRQPQVVVDRAVLRLLPNVEQQVELAVAAAGLEATSPAAAAHFAANFTAVQLDVEQRPAFLQGDKAIVDVAAVAPPANHSRRLLRVLVPTAQSDRDHRQDAGRGRPWRPVPVARLFG